ncbi:VanW family protein [Neobacillus sp. D3-1R]|uniref:VanW family protein n=1 Tax=Neobacillus sp. D3-1R TaxID=3445778 RepID=UPI003F9F116C
MIISWILGISLFSQQLNTDNIILVGPEGKTIETIQRDEYLLPIPGGIFINVDQYIHFLEAMDQQIYKPPINATVGENGNIVSEQLGYRLDRDLLTSKLYNHFLNPGANIIGVPTIPIYPRVDSELLSTILEKKIGTYITYFNAHNEKRSHNIILAAEAINNKVVFPGETFSFNRVVGKRTKDKGYLQAPIIVRGELSEGIGGGICQVSSTLFNAVDNAGLKIMERYSHSKRVPYVPQGRDATVSWYGPDFSFKNKFNQPIFIKTKVYEGKLVVSIYSSDLINNTPKKIPSASSILPKEINVDIGVDDE